MKIEIVKGVQVVTETTTIDNTLAVIIVRMTMIIEIVIAIASSS